jgi:hypothetical protein
MKKNITYLSSLAAVSIFSVVTLLSSCGREELKTTTPVTPPVVSNGSFEEEFTNAGTLAAKGWVFKNNSFPLGVSGWRQGRFESGNAMQYKFLAPVPFLGFPAFSAESSPNDFISCDISAASDANASQSANYNAWLISPPVPMKNGDQIIFWTRASDDSQYPVYCTDRMQVRANFNDGSSNVGTGDTTTGKFNTLLLDINPNYVFNDPASGSGGGYPRDWTQMTITISGLPAIGVSNARFAFRYMGLDAGFFGGSTGNFFPTVVGIDKLSFVRN